MIEKVPQSVENIIVDVLENKKGGDKELENYVTEKQIKLLDGYHCPVCEKPLEVRSKTILDRCKPKGGTFYCKDCNFTERYLWSSLDGKIIPITNDEDTALLHGRVGDLMGERDEKEILKQIVTDYLIRRWDDFIIADKHKKYK